MTEDIFRQKSISSSRGFTLLEVMVSIALLAIVLTAIYRLHTQTIAMANATRFYTSAPLLLQSKIGHLQTLSFDSSSAGSGDFGDNFPEYFWKVRIDDVESEYLGDVADDLKKIMVEVSYGEDEALSYSTTMYRITDEKN
ncbi:prepilin-type N-terminal cleavage/methylation domain-containing protein [Desulfobacterales bacterium HSG16]|nr:prepilin-type N-terminal cleavage/methylation domain-containing protein [Desulfobacterales bacterium HSG16]